jgi:hypothetical protein
VTLRLPAHHAAASRPARSSGSRSRCLGQALTASSVAFWMSVEPVRSMHPTVLSNDSTRRAIRQSLDVPAEPPLSPVFDGWAWLLGEKAYRAWRAGRRRACLET